MKGQGLNLPKFWKVLRLRHGLCQEQSTEWDKEVALALDIIW